MRTETVHTFVILAYKESLYLEACIQSVLSQRIESEVVIATSTPNEYISTFANKYQLKIIVNSDGNKGIGRDFDFALFSAKTDLITIAHQDDIYEPDYSMKIIEKFKKYPKATIIFSDYYEYRDMEKVYKNVNLRIKRFLLLPLRMKFLSKQRLIKRSCLAFGNAICCPAVTFVRENITLESVFDSEFQCNVDWCAWEKVSNLNGNFIYIKDKTMGHRVHEESTTTEILKDNIRTVEDLKMFRKFWPMPIAKMLNKFYIRAEKSNKV